MAFEFPKIYPILDSSIIPSVPSAGRERFLQQLGESLADAGVTLLEYRNKTGKDVELLADGAVLRRTMSTGKVKLILDDRVHLVEAMHFDGVHVDAGDLSPSQVRLILGPERMIGTFGGSDSLLPGILDAPADYLAVGPVFTTTTKQTDKAPIGVEGVRRLRLQAGPDVILTAAAGITLETASSILEAGANAVAVFAAIFRAPNPAAEFRRWLERLG